jgi:hypothetical protein
MKIYLIGTDMNINKWLAAPITPIIAGLYPFLFYWSVNANQVGSDDAWRSFFVVLVISIILLSVFWLISRDINKASVSGTIILLAFFSYGHIFTWLRLQNMPFARHSILLPIMIIVSAMVVWVLFRTSGNLKPLIGFLNGTLLLLSLFSIVQITSAYSKTENLSPEAHQKQAPATTPIALPDIYLIVVDEYPRADVLKKSFNYDNSEFLDQLEELRFRVIPCSQSNYRWTIQALYAMLNLEYAPPDPFDRFAYTNQSITNRLSKDIKNGYLINALRQRGYQLVAFETGYAFTELDDAEIFLKSSRMETLSLFEEGLIETSMLAAWDDLAIRLGLIDNSNPTKAAKRLPRSSPDYYYQIKMDGFNNLDESIMLDTPKFVFAHLLGAHFPIAIDANGNHIYTSKLEREPYLSQILYTNKRLISSMQQIINTTGTPPIVVLVSDHGLKYDDFDAEGEYTDSLLNFGAVFGPTELTSKLYDSITPVNIMRLLAAQQEIGDYEILPDISYYNDPDTGKLIEFPNSCLP